MSLGADLKIDTRNLADILKSVRGLYVGDDRNYSYVGMRGFSRPDGHGTVLVHGEYWDAAGAAGAEPGESVRIVRVNEFTLTVERRVS